MKKSLTTFSLAIVTTVLLSITNFSIAQQSQSFNPVRIGNHMMSLHWLWDQYGTLVVSEPDSANWQQAEGKMYAKEGFLSIKGKLKPIARDELLFEGRILTKTNYTDDVCTREGTYHFKATGKRQYWRLQEMKSCEGGNVVDYIDIYFK